MPMIVEVVVVELERRWNRRNDRTARMHEEDILADAHRLFNGEELCTIGMRNEHDIRMVPKAGRLGGQGRLSCHS